MTEFLILYLLREARSILRVYGFNEGNSFDISILGQKGVSLCEMTRLGETFHEVLFHFNFEYQAFLCHLDL